MVEIKDRAAFVVSFDGPGIESGRIDVRDLAPALLSLGRLIDAANIALYGEQKPINLQAKATTEGSFEVVLEVVRPYWENLTALLDGKDSQQAKNLLEWLGIFGMKPAVVVASLVGLYRFLGGKRPQKVARAENGQFRVEIDDKTILVPLEVMRLYQDISVNKAFSDLLTATESESVNRIAFRPEHSSREQPSLCLTSNDRAAFSIEGPPASVLLDDTRKIALSIRSLTFQEGNKWKLFDGQNTITATIEDRDFISKVDANILRFAKGDVLICDVRSIQTQGRDGLRTEHSVLKVIEHKPAPTQIPLPLEDGGK